MELLLVFLLTTFLLAARGANRGRRMRTWPLIVACFLVGAVYLSQRVI
jgi:hypothetical protein